MTPHLPAEALGALRSSGRLVIVLLVLFQTYLSHAVDLPKIPSPAALDVP